MFKRKRTVNLKMLQALNMPGARDIAEYDIPYVAAEAGRLNGANACAAMMLAGTLGPQSNIVKPEVLSAFSMVPNHEERATLHGHTLQSLSNAHGVGVTVVSALDLPAFANRGWSALPDKMHDSYRHLTDNALTGEKFSMGSLLGKLVERSAYEQRAATLDDVVEARQARWSTLLLVNGRALDGKLGFQQRGLMVLEADAEKVTVHDPGSFDSEGQARKVCKPEQILEAWQDTGNTLIAAGFARQMGSYVMSQADIEVWYSQTASRADG